MIPRIQSAASAVSTAVYHSCAYVGHKLKDLFAKIQSVVSRIFGLKIEPQNPSEDVFRRHFSPEAPKPAKKVDVVRTTTLPKKEKTPPAPPAPNKAAPPKKDLPPAPTAPAPKKEIPPPAPKKETPPPVPKKETHPPAPVEFEEIKVLGDGNCLFRSMLVHLNRNREKIEKANPDMKEMLTHEGLRKLAVQDMRNYNNDPALLTHLEGAVDDHDTVKDAAWRDEVSSLDVLLARGEIDQENYDAQLNKGIEKLEQGKLKDKGDNSGVDAYINHAAEDKFFAGYPEIYVLAKRMGVQVVVETEYKHGNKTVKIDNPLGQDTAGCGPLRIKCAGLHFNPMVPKNPS